MPLLDHIVERFDLKERNRWEKGKLRVDFDLGRKGWLEHYVGPKDAGLNSEEMNDPANWVVRGFGWKVIKGDPPYHKILSKEWCRFLMGKGYVHIRVRPFILVWVYYNRKVDIHLRYN